ncbi:hypothetical protein MIR68_010969 [Amoeboaphelidium protococcarum]|nr:hypothetical protein MIR68_010969 [Amoeboaphelidium protococcarum]
MSGTLQGEENLLQQQAKNISQSLVISNPDILASARIDGSDNIKIDDGASDIKAALEIEVENLAISSEQQLSPEEQERKRMKRFLVTQELFETERGYVNDLNNLVRNFLDPLNGAYLAGVASQAQRTEASTAADIVQNTQFGNERGGGWITFDQKQAIVRNAANLLRVQKLVLKILEDAVRTPWGQLTPLTPSSSSSAADQPVCDNPSISSIAKCFLTMMQKLESVYVPFCSLHDKALNTLAIIRRTHPNSYQSFHEDCKQKMNSKLEIQDFLIKPVQRICKYPLLFNELLKATPKGTPEFEELSQTLQQIKALVATINEKKKRAENDTKKELLFSRVQSSPYVTIKALLELFELSVVDELKYVHLHPQAQDFFNKIGNLLRGSGIYVADHGQHDMPFTITASMVNPSFITDTPYLGTFLFQDVLLLLSAKKSGSYLLQHIIPVKNVVSIQELSSDAIEPNSFGRAALKNSWRITWEQPSSNDKAAPVFRSVDLGAKSSKEKRGWMLDLEKVLGVSKVNYLETLDSNHDLATPSEGPDSARTRSSSAAANGADVGNRRKNTSMSNNDNQSIAPSVMSSNSDNQEQQMQNSQAAVDAKFIDVYTTESLVLTKGASAMMASQSALNKMSNLMQAAADASSTASKALFRRVSQNGKRRESISSKDGGRRASIFGGGGADDGNKSTLSLAQPDGGATEPTPLGQIQGAKGSMANMAGWFSRNRSNSVASMNQSQMQDKNTMGSKMSLSSIANGDGSGGDNDKKKWGGTIKAKILSIGKFNASSRNLTGGGNIPANTSVSSLASVMTTESKKSGKKSFLTSLTRSLSKSRLSSAGKVDDQTRQAIDRALDGKQDSAASGNLTPQPPPRPAGEPHQPHSPSEKPSGIFNILNRRSNMRLRTKTSTSSDGDNDGNSVQQQQPNSQPVSPTPIDSQNAATVQSAAAAPLQSKPMPPARPRRPESVVMQQTPVATDTSMPVVNDRSAETSYVTSIASQPADQQLSTEPKATPALPALPPSRPSSSKPPLPGGRKRMSRVGGADGDSATLGDGQEQNIAAAIATSNVE